MLKEMELYQNQQQKAVLTATKEKTATDDPGFRENVVSYALALDGGEEGKRDGQIKLTLHDDEGAFVGNGDVVASSDDHDNKEMYYRHDMSADANDQLKYTKPGDYETDKGAENQSQRVEIANEKQEQTIKDHQRKMYKAAQKGDGRADRATITITNPDGKSTNYDIDIKDLPPSLLDTTKLNTPEGRKWLENYVKDHK